MRLHAARLTTLVLGAALACGGRHADPDRVATSCAPFAASDDRSAFAYLDDERLVVRTAAGTRVVPRAACTRRADRLFVAPGGTAVAAYGTASNIAFDLWGHAGKHTTATCVVDTASGRERPFTGAAAFAWVDGEVVELGDDQLPAPAPRCTVATTASGPVAVCVDDATLVVRRYRGRALEHDAADQRWPVGDIGGGRVELAISPDGRRLAYWSARLRVIDLASGRALLAMDDIGAVSAVEHDPTGRDRVMLIGAPYEGGTEPTRRVRVVGFDGAVLATRTELGADRVLYWTEPDAYWSTHFCGAERVELGLRAPP
jgi:hypothetical protein